MKKFSFTLPICVLCLLGITSFTSISVFANENHLNNRTCTNSAKILKPACDFEVRDDYFAGVAVCLNFSDKDEKSECLKEARQAQREARGECREVRQARKELCKEIGEDPYDPPFGEDYADDFVNPLEIGVSITPNPYLPLVQGNEWIYEGKTIDDEGEEEIETITVNVTNRTKLIDGITCIEVRDEAQVDEAAVEVTFDWYAQHINGDVWYCGEISQNYENFEGNHPEIPELVDIDGSRKTGRDGAKPGILLPFLPVVGDIHRQEVAWGDAEDVIKILAINETESSSLGPHACSGDCLVTNDFTPLDSEANENKYYAPDTGLIVEIDLNTGDRVELVEFNSL